MDLQTVHFSTWSSPQGHTSGIIKIARPQALNALNRQVLNDLGSVVAKVQQDHSIRALILTGEGEKAFVAGADIKEMENLNVAEARELSLSGQALLQKLEDLPIPVIAAVNGFALGGGLELALACDFMLASNKARWGLPEVTLGLIPGYGGTQRLTRVLGRALAKRIALSGEMFTAQQGYEWGLFAELFEPAQLFPAAQKLAETLASRAPIALALAKESIHRGGEEQLKDGLRREADLFARSFETQDHGEGIKAFIEKRPAQFQGK